MQFIFIGIGSVLAILFMIRMKKGKKFESIVENLDDSKALDLVVNEMPQKVGEKDFIISGTVYDENHDGKQL